MQTTSTSLLIAVSDYSNYDRSAGLPVGSSNLFSPQNNLTSMWQLLRGIGFAAPDFAITSSPLCNNFGAHPGFYGEATRDLVLQGVEFVAHNLASSDQTRALIYFSGHGAWDETEGPVLCPTDLRSQEGTLINMVSLAEIEAMMSEIAPGKSVTFILDCCDSGLPGTSSPVHRPSLWRLGQTAKLRDRDVLFSSTGPRHVGVETRIDGAWHGAFTWALCQAANQFAHRPGEGFLYLDLSLKSLATRAGQLLQGLSIPQTPQLEEV